MKRGGFLKRRTPLKRSRMRRNTRRSSYSRRERDREYMKWVKCQPCAIAEEPEHRCDGPVEADHAGEIGTRALGRKAPDDTCIPLCTKAHMERQRWRGFFSGWGVIRVREWTEAVIARLRKQYLATLPRLDEPQIY